MSDWPQAVTTPSGAVHPVRVRYTGRYEPERRRDIMIQEIQRAREWPDIPVLRPITTPLRELNPEALR